MDRMKKIKEIRTKLKSGDISIGSWMQLHDPSVAELLGHAGYDWIAVDMEHGTYSHFELPNLFRALELGQTLPLVRLLEGNNNECKLALDAGAGGVIIPNVQCEKKLKKLINASKWPPVGSRGVGFSRANLFGVNFEDYSTEAKEPIVVAMIESKEAIDNLEPILKVDGLDAIFVGPYDLSASLGCLGDFDDKKFRISMKKIKDLALKMNIPMGMHIVKPDTQLLEEKIKEGYQFIAYSIDAVVLSEFIVNPFKK